MKNRPTKIAIHSCIQSDGRLRCINNLQEILSFQVKRFFIIDNIPMGISRGNHANCCTQFLFIPLEGEILLTLDNGIIKEEITLIEGEYGLFVPPMHWIMIESRKEKSSILVLADSIYDSGQYIEVYAEFLNAVKEENK